MNAPCPVASLAAIGSPGAQQPILIKFSHVFATGTPKRQAAEKFKQLAEGGTKGRVKVGIYPNSQLHKDGVRGASTPPTQGRSPVRESCTPGSVRGRAR